MKPRAILSDVPPESAINARLSGAYFYDCYVISVPDTTPAALNYFLTALANTPHWVNSLMALRNKIVRLVGLKDLGGLGELNPSKPASAYAPGDRVGIFTLISNSPNEALLGDRDKHLDVVLSVYKHPLGQGGVQSVSVTTVVHIHNLLGRIYMLPVTPLHKLIAPAVLNRIMGGQKCGLTLRASVEHRGVGRTAPANPSFERTPLRGFARASLRALRALRPHAGAAQLAPRSGFLTN